MKQAFLFLILVALFSHLSALSLLCHTNLKMVCYKLTVESCKCAPKNAQGDYAYVQECNSPYHPICSGDSTSLKCICSL